MKIQRNFDCTIIGAGIAGVSLAYELARHGLRVLLLEAEERPAYHATGRSAAFYDQAYGNRTIRCLTRYSHAFFDKPPQTFCEYPLLSDRGALYIARKDQLEPLHRMYKEVGGITEDICLADRGFAEGKISALRDKYVEQCLWVPGSKEIDVAAMLQGYLTKAKQMGAQLYTQARVTSLRFNNGCWTINCPRGEFTSDLVVNAAGAWADEVATLAGAPGVGLVPKKRSACIVPQPDDSEVSEWPLVIDIEHQFYFKPDGGNLLISPADETPVNAMDAYSETLDIATAIDRVSRVIDIELSRVSHEWAGLRSFVSDNSPVVGFDEQVPGFFWLAGQGGYGIQIAPALAVLASNLIRGEGMPLELRALGFDYEWVRPSRCQDQAENERFQQNTGNTGMSNE